MKTPIVLNIQKYSIHDGDGIRTSVFFKGCMLTCRWCHNPESQNYTPELMFNRESCNGCGLCSRNCPNDAITFSEEGVAVTNRILCKLCSQCVDYCAHNNREIVGRKYSVNELMKFINQDACFYEESGGGVTLSGGEVMSQDMDYLEELCRKIKKKGYHLAIDTCGYAPTENYKRLLPYVDVFLYDIKTLDDEVHVKFMGQSNEQIRLNLKFLADQKAVINIRIPVVEPVNSDVGTMEDIIQYLKETVGIVKVNLLPYHNTGSSKYEKLGREYPAKDFRTPSAGHMEMLKERFQYHGFQNVKIGG